MYIEKGLTMKKAKSVLKKVRKKVSRYFSTNRLFLLYLVFAVIETLLIRHFTIGNVFDYQPFICDLALIIIIGAFGYFFHKTPTIQIL